MGLLDELITRLRRRADCRDQPTPRRSSTLYDCYDSHDTRSDDTCNSGDSYDYYDYYDYCGTRGNSAGADLRTRLGIVTR
ncbi:hypothetical protein ACWC10_08815 [Streptomyces sp. NPDC001595]|uniref:hypothetical protein n=1 Tax=Streptomyces sp. NPDC001532 TaxID=3154520 RepID=UPI00332F4436